MSPICLYVCHSRTLSAVFKWWVGPPCFYRCYIVFIVFSKRRYWMMWHFSSSLCAESNIALNNSLSHTHTHGRRRGKDRPSYDLIPWNTLFWKIEREWYFYTSPSNISQHHISVYITEEQPHSYSLGVLMSKGLQWPSDLDEWTQACCQIIQPCPRQNLIYLQIICNTYLHSASRISAGVKSPLLQIVIHVEIKSSPWKQLSNFH